MSKIKSICIPNTNFYCVGMKINGFEITEIVNLNQEYSDHTEYFYQVKSGDKILIDIIDCSVVVEYETA